MLGDLARAFLPGDRNCPTTGGKVYLGFHNQLISKIGWLGPSDTGV